MIKDKEDSQVPVTKHLEQFRAMLEEAEVEFEEGATAGQEFGDYIQVRDTIFIFDDEGSLVDIDTE